MNLIRHEIPTHLNVEDKALFGLSVRQVMLLIVGVSLAYGLWNQLPDVVLPLHLGLSALVFLAFAAVALFRPGQRPLEEWLFVVAHYALVPRLATWYPTEPPLLDWLLDDREWEELTPEPIWGEKLQ